MAVLLTNMTGPPADYLLTVAGYSVYLLFRMCVGVFLSTIRRRRTGTLLLCGVTLDKRMDDQENPWIILGGFASLHAFLIDFCTRV
jgi:hypothetical protein